MPVTRSRNGLYDAGNLDGNNTARFLFGDDDMGDSRLTATTTSDESFPTLIRRDDPLVCITPVLPCVCASAALSFAGVLVGEYP